MSIVIEGKSKLQPLLTTKEVAELLRYSPQHIARLARSGKLQHIEVAGALRFRRDYIITLMSGGTEKKAQKEDQ